MTEKLQQYFENIIEKIIHPPQGILPYHFVTPAPLKKEINRQKGFYAQQYDWDLYFEGVALAQIAPGKMPFFKEALLNFLEFTTASGKTPRTISPLKFWDPYDQHKPFLVQGCLLAAKSLKDFNWIQENVWEKLKNFLNFWEERRGFHGLVRWRSVLESGVDNNPTIMNLPDYGAESVDASVYLVCEYLAMAKIAKNLGKNEKIWENKAENLKKRINVIFWHQEDKMYYDVFNMSDDDIDHVKVKSWTCLTPLWAKIPNQEQADALIKKYILSENEFLSLYGLRTLSKNELCYNVAPRGIVYIHSEKRRWVVSNWQGPIWVVANWIITQGLVNYGYIEEAIDIAKRVIAVLEKDITGTSTLHENYNPETGQGLWAPNFGSWNLLARHWLENLEQKRNH